MFERILFPTDGSDGSDAALDHVLAFASQYDARVDVLYVVDRSALDRATEIEDAEAFGEETVADAATRAGEAGVEATTAVRTGIPHREILDYAADRDADLLAAGTHGRSGLGRYLLGSVTEKVVRLADRPVLTVRIPEVDASYLPYEAVLVPTDGSEGASRAADYGVDVASAFGATLHALSAVESASPGLDAESDAADDAVEAHRADAEAVVSRARDRGIDAAPAAVETGAPHESILNYVDEHGVDLVVMGTHGRTGVERFVIGSVAEKVVRLADCPVLTVHAGEDA